MAGADFFFFSFFFSRASSQINVVYRQEQLLPRVVSESRGGWALLGHLLFA